MVGEEVDFVDVEDTVVGFGKESGAVGGFALGEDGFQVEGTDNAVFGGTDGKVDEWGITKEGSEGPNGCGFGCAFSPRMTTPPIRGAMAVRMRESCNWSWPTTAENGYLAAIMSDM